MSVFNADDTPAVFLTELVGEGKKFSDPEALAKGKWEADRAIEARNQELAELRAELDARTRIEDLLKNVQPKTEPVVVPPVVEANQPAKPAATQEDLAELVKKAMDDERVNTRAAENVNAVSAKLIEVYGDETKANAVVKQRAAELGVSVEFLQSTAVQSPKAFFDLLGVDQKITSHRPTQGDVNPQAFGQNNGAVKPGTYKFYEQMRKENPVQWQKLQPQIHKEALEKGDSFFD